MGADEGKEILSSDIKTADKAEPTIIRHPDSEASLSYDEKVEKAKASLDTKLKEIGEKFNHPELEGTGNIHAMMHIPEGVPMGHHLQSFIDTVTDGSSGARIVNIAYIREEDQSDPEAWNTATLELTGGAGSLNQGAGDYGSEPFGFIDHFAERAYELTYEKGAFFRTGRKVMKMPETDLEQAEWNLEVSEADETSKFATPQELEDLEKLLSFATDRPPGQDPELGKVPV
ncbi:MAG: hypothetical protein AAB512_02915 [Patescibacteria group bacterium]